MRFVLFALALLWAPFTAAQMVEQPDLSTARPVAPDEFEARVEGRTIGWRYPGGAVGVEYYMPGGRVLWEVERGDCTPGRWYAQGEQICFVYGEGDTPGCWYIFDIDGILAVESASGLGLIVVEKGDAAPLICGGPGV